MITGAWLSRTANKLHVVCMPKCNVYAHTNGDLRCSLDVNFEMFNLSFEPEDKIKMGSCMWGVYGVFNDDSDDVLIVRIGHVNQKLWFFEIINFEYS